MLKKEQVITHRGLEPTKKDFYSESTFEAFEDHLKRGFGGVEFDVRFLKDGEIAVVHDPTLVRITGGMDTRKLEELGTEDIRSVQLPRGRIGMFDELMDLIRSSSSVKNALHFKGTLQTTENISKLLTHLKRSSDMLEKMMIFDVTPDTARTMLTVLPHLYLVASVAHPYDIQRYNDAVGGTLLSIEEAIKGKKEGLFKGVWLDEWDLTGPHNTTKDFYNEETFKAVRDAGLSVSLVTPELHATSPGLLGGEAHPDAQSRERLFERIRNIISLNPDWICTDYPEEILTL